MYVFSNTLYRLAVFLAFSLDKRMIVYPLLFFIPFESLLHRSVVAFENEVDCSDCLNKSPSAELCYPSPKRHRSTLQNHTLHVHVSLYIDQTQDPCEPNFVDWRRAVCIFDFTA
jgi:hypothetical protein